MASNDIFIDTSFFRALLDEDDDFHQQSVLVWDHVTGIASYRYITSNFVLDESLTLLRIRCGLMRALGLREFITKDNSEITIVRVLHKDEIAAWQWFEKNWSGLSFTDCVSFALMQRLEIKHVLTFDAHFKRAGFTLLTSSPVQ